MALPVAASLVSGDSPLLFVMLLSKFGGNFSYSRNGDVNSLIWYMNITASIAI